MEYDIYDREKKEIRNEIDEVKRLVDKNKMS
jgi:hypothetical protein